MPEKVTNFSDGMKESNEIDKVSKKTFELFISFVYSLEINKAVKKYLHFECSKCSIHPLSSPTL